MEEFFLKGTFTAQTKVQVFYDCLVVSIFSDGPQTRIKAVLLTFTYSVLVKDLTPSRHSINSN